MTTMVRWLPLLAIACTGKVEEDDSQPTGGDDSSTADDSSTNDDTGEKVTKGDRWNGTYVGGWVLTFDKVGSTTVPGLCDGALEITINGQSTDTISGASIATDVTTNECKGVGIDFYGGKPKATMTEGTIMLNAGFPSNTGGAHFALVGTTETCEFDFDWTFSDIENHPVQVTAEYLLRSEDQFKEFFCAGSGYSFELQAEIPKKD